MVRFIYNTIKAANRYVVQGSDTTMITRVASLFGQKIFGIKTDTLKS